MALDNSRNYITGRITRETFKKLEIEDKLNALFDVQVDMCLRLQRLEKRKRWDTTISSISGLLGGILFWIGVKIRGAK